MRAVVTVIGKDMVGILAKVSTACAAANDPKSLRRGRA